MKRMEIKGIDKTFVTLHVGLGNFRTVDVEDLSKHKDVYKRQLLKPTQRSGRIAGIIVHY